jgi:hypothetical protein
MPIKRFSGTFKSRTDVLDNITPNNKVQANVSVPAGEWKPAAWLPIEWTDQASDDSYVISSGKVVSFDREGRVVPSGWRLAFGGTDPATNAQVAGAGAGTACLVYTALDVTSGVIDLTTGVAVANAVTYNQGQVTTALLDRGLVAEADMGFAPAAIFATGTVGHLQDVADAFISNPVGVSAYDVFVWAGETAGGLNFVNYQKQHLVQFLTDIQMKVPQVAHVPAVSTISLDAAGPWTPGTAAPNGQGTTFPDADVVAGGAELFVNQAQLNGLQRYSADVPAAPVAGQGVVAYALTRTPLAADTTRTPVTSSANLLIRKRGSVAAVIAGVVGDWFLDADVGLLVVFSADGTTNAAGGGETVSYSFYDAVNQALAHRHIHLSGIAQAGQFLTFDQRSNFVPAGSAVAADLVGRTLALQNEPAGLLDRVRTAWNSTGMAADAQMPGSATLGFSDLLTLSGETVSNQIVVINVKIQ